MLNLSTHQSEDDIPREHIHPKYKEMDRKLHSKLCEDISDMPHNNPQDEVPTKRSPQQRERPQKRRNKNENQTLTTQQPNELYEQMEPITLSIYNSHSKGSCTKYVMETTLSHISFQIMKPTYIHVQLMPFTIFLKTNRLQKRTNSPRHYKKFIVLQGLNILKQSNTYFYFRPALNYRNILIEDTVNFCSNIRLRLTKTACCQSLRIPKGTHVGTLHPVLLTKYVKEQ